MNKPPFLFRFAGLLLVTASFFMGKILTVFPGLPLQVGAIPLKHLIFGVGVLLYFVGARISHREWSKSLKEKKGEEP